MIVDNGFLTPARWVGIKYLENDVQVIEKGDEKDQATSEKLQAIVKKLSQHLDSTLNSYSEVMISDYQYGHITSVLKQDVIHRQFDENRLQLTGKIDKVVANPFLGPLLMLAVVYGLYQFAFSYNEVPVDWFESFFGWLSDLASNALPDDLMKSLIISGMINTILFHQIL